MNWCTKILPLLFLWATACVNPINYGVDAILQDPFVKKALVEKQASLIGEYNESKRYATPVKDIDFDLLSKKWSEDRDRVEFTFAQQVRDEFGKRIPLFETRIILLVFKRNRKGDWELHKEGYK